MVRARPVEGPARALDLTVVGHTNLDHFLQVPKLPSPDRTVPLEGFRTELGGTAATIARAASRWGVRVGLLSRVGEDFPTDFEERLARAGIELSGVEHVRGAHSSACYIIEDGKGAQMTLIHQGPMGAAANAPVPRALLRSSSWVHLTTGDPKFQLRVAAVARSERSHVAADPAQEVHYLWNGPGLKRLLAFSEILFGNTSEIDRAEELLGVGSRRELLERVPLIVETQGAGGATAYTRAGTVRAPARRPRRLKQITGAGDAFRGGFYAGWFSGQPLPHCLAAGTRSAAWWMETGGEESRRGRGGR